MLDRSTPLSDRAKTSAWPANLGRSSSRLLRDAESDRWFIFLALAHGIALLMFPGILVIGLGLWWNTNTISHNFIHRPFFRKRQANWAFSLYLTLLLGIPQTFWRDRHLAHHAGISRSCRWSAEFVSELGLLTALWCLVIAGAPEFFLTVYLPGLSLGLGLCQIHGHYEHARGTVSHYGRIYNLLFFNDGYHVEHHARPAEVWRRLPFARKAGAVQSRWPAVLRWLERLNLEMLERLVLRSQRLQQFMIRSHLKAFAAILPQLPKISRIGIVGGGLFPRTALVLQRLLPEAQLILIDCSAENLETARRFVGERVQHLNRFYEPLSGDLQCDLIVIPLAYIGDRSALYQKPPAPFVLVHDWVWRRWKEGTVISWRLLKRLNLVRG